MIFYLYKVGRFCLFNIGIFQNYKQLKKDKKNADSKMCEKQLTSQQ